MTSEISSADLYKEEKSFVLLYTSCGWSNSNSFEAKLFFSSLLFFVTGVSLRLKSSLSVERVDILLWASSSSSCTASALLKVFSIKSDKLVDSFLVLLVTSSVSVIGLTCFVIPSKFSLLSSSSDDQSIEAFLGMTTIGCTVVDVVVSLLELLFSSVLECRFTVLSPLSSTLL